MVNKGSFFQRLKERWGSSSRVRVNQHGSDRASNGGGRPAVKPAAVERVAADREVATGAPAERKSSRKMSDREEAMVALGSHFEELTTLLRGSQSRTEDQLGKIVGATDALSALPALGQQQLDTLRALSVHMEKQSAVGEQMAATVTKLPGLLESVEQALARAAKTDERTAATVKEFHTTMDRIHTSMNKMVEQGGEQVEVTRQLAERRDDALLDIAQGIESSQREALNDLQRTTDDSLTTLRRTHEDQSNRLQRVVEDHASWNRAVVFGIGLVVLGIGALIALQVMQ